MTYSVAFIALASLLLSSCHCGSLPAAQQAEQTLITSLLAGYNKNVRPDEQVSVDITASLQQIVSMDEKQQIMTSSSFISQKWTDERLSWTANSTFNFIKVVMLPVKSIWTPDTMVLNSADANGYLTVSDSSLASVNEDGEVYMILPALTVKTRCSLFVQKFPFDRQVCTINLTSWGQGANRVVYTDRNDEVIDITHYSEHPIWKLNGTDLVVIQSADRVPYEDTYNAVISIQLYLQRKPLFFMMNGIFACLILNCVTLLSYALPFGSQIGLCKSSLFSLTQLQRPRTATPSYIVGMTCFMTYSVYSLNFSGLFPQQSEYLMTITLYFLLSIVWTLLSMVWFVICNHYASRGEMPKLLYAFCGLLEKGFVCCFSLPPPPKDDKTSTKQGVPVQDGESKKPATEDKANTPKLCLSCCRRSPKVECVKAEVPTTVEETQPVTGQSIEEKPSEASVSITMEKPAEEPKPKCNFCDRCESCHADFTKDKTKGKGKKDVESKCSALNYFVFICVLLFMFIANMAVWFSMAN